MAGTANLERVYRLLGREAARRAVQDSWMKDKIIEAADLVQEVILDLAPKEFDIWPVLVDLAGQAHVLNWCETHKRPEKVCFEMGAHK